MNIFEFLAVVIVTGVILLLALYILEGLTVKKYLFLIEFKEEFGEKFVGIEAVNDSSRISGRPITTAYLDGLVKNGSLATKNGSYGLPQKLISRKKKL